MKTNYRIEILGTNNEPLKCNNVKELKEVFLHGNVVKYKVISVNNASADQIKRIEIGTPQLDFRFNSEERSASDEIEFMKTRIRELQKFSKNWFDKRTKEYKYAISFANGFNTPLLFEEL